MAAPYTLYYLTARGIGEPIRMLLHYAGQPFNDERFELQTLLNHTEPKQKEFPYGKVPVLIIENGVKLHQSRAIGRYLAKKYNLLGKDDIEAAHVDAMVDLYFDFFVSCRPFIRCWAGYEQGDAAALIQTHLIPALETFVPKFEETLAEAGSGYYAKSGLTWADFFLGELSHAFLSYTPEFFQKYPLFVEHGKRLYNLPGIREYVAKRPTTKF